MNCDEAEELLGAHALDALTDDEAARLRAHLATCPQHAGRARDLVATARRLPASADAVPPPSALRARVLDAIARTPQDAADAGDARVDLRAAAQSPAPAKVTPLRRRIAPGWLAVAAVFVAAIVGLAAWNIILQTRDNGGSVQRLASHATSIAALDMQGGSATAGAQGVVVYYGDEKKALVVANGVPAVAPARAYQLWAIDAAGPRSLGLMPVGDDGSAAIVVPFDIAQSRQIAVTLEPPGGSAQPTSPPIMRAQI